jgi:NADPH:quinone reductase-like Zn-dependent oxidoreductase
MLARMPCNSRSKQNCRFSQPLDLLISNMFVSLGADMVVNYKTTKFEDVVPPVDAVLDTVGGETQHRSFRVLKPGGILVSSVSPPPQTAVFRSVFFLVDVTAARLTALARLFDGRKLNVEVGSVLPLEVARRAHEMLAGAPHKRGKIVLAMQESNGQGVD